MTITERIETHIIKAFEWAVRHPWGALLILLAIAGYR